MIIFLTTVRHPLNSFNYRKVEALLERMMLSVCNQTSSDFRLVIVCNQVPNFSFVPSKVDFVLVDFPPPSHQKGANLDINACWKDKGTKKFIGLLHARQYSPEYVMFVDADDLVSNRIAEYVNSHTQENGWFLDKGYIYGDGGVLVRWTNEFHMKCGSSHIINWELLNVPSHLPNQLSQEEVLAKVDPNFFKKVLSIHRETLNYYMGLGLPTKPLPFPAGIWVLDTGENRSGKSLMSIGYPVSKRIKKEFNLETPPLSLKLVKDYLLDFPLSVSKLATKIQEKISNRVRC